MYSFGVLLLIGTYFSATYALPTCVCTRERRPVCGSDGITYSNRCLLDCASSKDPSIRMLSGGRCGREADNCICTFEFNPVCGSDGETYPNQCSLKCRQNQQPELAVSYRGACRNTRQVNNACVCTRQVNNACVCTRQLKPVCGTDGVTYSNPCMLNCARETKPELRMLHPSDCDDEARVETPQRHPCACGRNLDPVCASNGVTYPNPCMMKCAGQLTIKSRGPCDE